MGIKWVARKALYRAGLWSWLNRQRTRMHLLRQKPHESEFEFFRGLKGPMLVLDIGANEGQSAVSLRSVNPHFQIVSFEPNRLMEQNLRFTQRLLGSGFEFHLLGLGRVASRQTMYVPYVQGVPLFQEATFRKEILTEDAVTRERILSATGQASCSIREFEFEITTLDALELSPHILKIDVQGLELDVLQGGEKTLRSARPLVMMENGIHFAGVAAYMKTLGFEPKIFDGQKLVASGDFSRPLNVFFEWRA